MLLDNCHLVLTASSISVLFRRTFTCRSPSFGGYFKWSITMMVSELVELRVRLERVEEVAARAWGMGPNQPTLTVRAVLTAYCNDDGRRQHARQSVVFSMWTHVEGWAKEWTLGCVNPASWLSLAAGGEFTQPRDHSFAQPCRGPTVV